MDIITKSHFEQFKKQYGYEKRKTVMLLNFFNILHCLKIHKDRHHKSVYVG